MSNEDSSVNPAQRQSHVSVADIERIVRDSLPLAALLGLRVETLEYGRCVTRMPFRRDLIRPGGTVAGPALMGLADFVMYVVVLSQIGPVELAVTTNLNINFLRKPGEADVIADGRCLKLGKRLAVLEVTLYSEGEGEPVAHVTGTYSIPPPDQRK
ncbi:MAG: PaaI family thioesterase [Alphaproteobacteria bacterium]|nr:PaaI family thioesterase [Alphaproteobacteria bacterium]